MGCHKFYDSNEKVCSCGCKIASREVRLYRDCGCDISLYYCSLFKMRTSIRSGLPQMQNYDLVKYSKEHNITHWLYCKLGAKTSLRFRISNCTKLKGIPLTYKDYGVPTGVTSYRLYVPNGRMIVNNIPCEFFYTEYTKSKYKGYFVTHVIALDYSIYDDHLKRCKLLRIMHRDKKSIFSCLPKELMLIIRQYLIAIFRLALLTT